MKRRPYLLLLTLGLMASLTLLLVWRERHRQQTRVHHASIAPTRERSTAQQDKPFLRGVAPNLLSLPTETSAAPVQQDADVWVHNKDWNKLCQAAEEDDLSIARKVIREGAGVNSRDKRRRTPLMYAAAYASMHVLNLLLAEGADVNARDDLGWTALMFAAQTDNVRVTSALLQHRANRRLRDHENHWTAKERAVHVGQDRVAELLRTGRIVKGDDSASRRQFAEGENNAPPPRTRAQVDAHRWIEAVHLPDIAQDMGEGACGVEVVDATGKRGDAFGGDTFFFLPEVQVFHDTDGRTYAFIKGHHRSETNFIIRIRGRRLMQACECDAYYEATCHPLPGGGALIVASETTYDKMEGKPLESIPVVHQHDDMAVVLRFRHRKLTVLGTIFLPGQGE